MSKFRKIIDEILVDFDDGSTRNLYYIPEQTFTSQLNVLDKYVLTKEAFFNNLDRVYSKDKDIRAYVVFKYAESFVSRVLYRNSEGVSSDLKSEQYLQKEFNKRGYLIGNYTYNGFFELVKLDIGQLSLVNI